MNEMLCYIWNVMLAVAMYTLAADAKIPYKMQHKLGVLKGNIKNKHKQEILISCFLGVQ